MATYKDAPLIGPSSFIDHFARSRLRPIAEQYTLDDDQFNAAKHAATSAIYADVFGSKLTNTLGDAFEIVNDDRGDDYSRDKLNNFLGLEVQKKFPKLAADQYYDLFSRMASEDLLWIPKNLDEMTREEIQDSVRQLVLGRLEKDGSNVKILEGLTQQ